MYMKHCLQSYHKIFSLLIGTLEGLLLHHSLQFLQNNRTSSEDSTLSKKSAIFINDETIAYIKAIVDYIHGLPATIQHLLDRQKMKHNRLHFLYYIK